MSDSQSGEKPAWQRLEEVMDEMDEIKAEEGKPREGMLQGLRQTKITIRSEIGMMHAPDEELRVWIKMCKAEQVPST